MDMNEVENECFHVQVLIIAELPEVHVVRPDLILQVRPDGGHARRGRQKPHDDEDDEAGERGAENADVRPAKPAAARRAARGGDAERAESDKHDRDAEQRPRDEVEVRLQHRRQFARLHAAADAAGRLMNEIRQGVQEERDAELQETKGDERDDADHEVTPVDRHQDALHTEAAQAAHVGANCWSTVLLLLKDLLHSLH